MNTTHNIAPYDPYELMITPPNKKAEMIIVQIAISNPNLDIVRDLIALGANLDWQNDSQFSPLLSCAAWKNPEIARMLIDAGADVRIWSRNGNTALDWCAIYYRPEIEITIRDSKAERIYKSINKRINEGDITLKDMIVLATGWYEGSDEYNIVLDYCIRNKKNILKTRHIFKKTLEANCDITALTQEFKEFLKV
jgi:hypothetical protein